MKWTEARMDGVATQHVDSGDDGITPVSSARTLTLPDYGRVARHPTTIPTALSSSAEMVSFH
jgi:hypothetical protein